MGLVYQETDRVWKVLPLHHLGGWHFPIEARPSQGVVCRGVGRKLWRDGRRQWRKKSSLKNPLPSRVECFAQSWVFFQIGIVRLLRYHTPGRVFHEKAVKGEIVHIDHEQEDSV